MATLDKSFRVKNGAIVEGSTGITARAADTQDALIVTGRAGGTGTFGITLVPATLTSSKTITFPDATGTVALTTNNLSIFASTTSAQLAGIISDETGSGALVFANTPTLVTPVLGVATATSINKLAITAPATAATLTIADGKTLTASNTLTFTGNDASSVAFGSGGTVAYTANKLSVFAATTSSELAGVISDETGSGALVFANSPSLTTPNIGVATGTSFNNITGLASTTSPMNGVAAVGIGTTVARADHVHPTDTSRAPLNNPTFTGTVTLPGDPTLALHAATKQYVDTAAAGLNAHAAVDAATTANLTATYSNGSSGVGATLTNSGTLAAFSVDGQSPALNARILVKNQSTQLQNGIYTLTTVGSGAVAWVLTRAEDQNTTPELGAGDLVYVIAGTANGTTLWVQTAKITTIGTDSVTWTQFSGASTATAGAGLVQNGNAYDVGGTSNRITVNADSIDIASTYVGQTSITTLGTIGTGTWQGSLVGPTYGGTGVNNGSNTITIGGNVSIANAFTTSGANALTLTTTGATNVTLPTSGTLLTTTGSGSSLTFGTGTLSLAGNVTHSGSFTQTFVATGNTNVTLPTSGTLLTTTGSGSSLTFGTGSLSLAGNLTTSGAFGVTLTATATTNVTLPTTGTLATLAGAESLTNKKLGSLTSNGLVTTSGGDGTLSVTAMAAGIATFLTTPSSANLAAAITDEQGSSGGLVFANSPTLTTPNIGAATATSVAFTNGQITSSTVTCPTAGTGYTLDTFATASFTSAKYMVQGTSGTEREVTEFLVTVNAADVHIAEYGNVFTNTDLFNITATLAAGTVTITVTPTTGNGGLVAKAMRTVIAA